MLLFKYYYFNVKGNCKNKYKQFINVKKQYFLKKSEYP